MNDSINFQYSKPKNDEEFMNIWSEFMRELSSAGNELGEIRRGSFFKLQEVLIEYQMTTQGNAYNKATSKLPDKIKEDGFELLKNFINELENKMNITSNSGFYSNIFDPIKKIVNSLYEDKKEEIFPESSRAKPKI